MPGQVLSSTDADLGQPEMRISRKNRRFVLVLASSERRGTSCTPSCEDTCHFSFVSGFSCGTNRVTLPENGAGLFRRHGELNHAQTSRAGLRLLASAAGQRR